MIQTAQEVRVDNLMDDLELLNGIVVKIEINQGKMRNILAEYICCVTLFQLMSPHKLLTNKMWVQLLKHICMNNMNQYLFL